MLKSKAPSYQSQPSRASAAIARLSAPPTIPATTNNNEQPTTTLEPNETTTIPTSSQLISLTTAPPIATIRAIPAAPVSKKSIRLPCLYTKHLTKKRKTFSDGILKISIQNGMVRCSLIDAADVREVPLESRLLEHAESQLFRNRVAHTLKFQQHLIEVSFDSENTDNFLPSTAPPVSGTGSSSTLIPKKFVPPSRYVPPPRPADEENNDEGENEFGSNFSKSYQSSSLKSSSSSGGNVMPSSTYGRYAVQEDELDEIWNSAPAKPSNAAMKGSKPSMVETTQPRKVRKVEDDDFSQAKSRKSNQPTNKKRSPAGERKEVRFETALQRKEVNNEEDDEEVDFDPFLTHQKSNNINNKKKRKTGGATATRTEREPIQSSFDPENENDNYEEETNNHHEPLSAFDGFNLTTNIWTD